MFSLKLASIDRKNYFCFLIISEYETTMIKTLLTQEYDYWEFHPLSNNMKEIQQHTRIAETLIEKINR